MRKNTFKPYIITFDKKSNDYPNWISISSMDKKLFYDFVNCLYSLNRKPIVLPYIPGGAPNGGAKPYMDKTYQVELLADEIFRKVPIDNILNRFVYCLWNKDDKIEDLSNLYRLFFIEDVYEYYLSIGIEKEKAKEQVYERYNVTIDNGCKQWLCEKYPFPFSSRWVFIYMFRSEFKKYMYGKGCLVQVDGGWILNDKKREMKLGLIDEYGNLLFSYLHHLCSHL